MLVVATSTFFEADHSARGVVQEEGAPFQIGHADKVGGLFDEAGEERGFALGGLRLLQRRPLLGNDPAHLHLGHHLTRKHPQRLDLTLIECARSGVDGRRACRSAPPSRRLHHRACVKADVRLAGDQRIVLEARVGPRVFDDHHVVDPQGMGTEGDRDRGLAAGIADADTGP